jgi:hypothetical protein
VNENPIKTKNIEQATFKNFTITFLCIFYIDIDVVDIDKVTKDGKILVRDGY